MPSHSIVLYKYGAEAKKNILFLLSAIKSGNHSAESGGYRSTLHLIVDWLT